MSFAEDILDGMFCEDCGVVFRIDEDFPVENFQNIVGKS